MNSFANWIRECAYADYCLWINTPSIFTRRLNRDRAYFLQDIADIIDPDGAYDFDIRYDSGILINNDEF